MTQPPTNDLLSRRDLQVVWHPCTQMKDHESLPPIPIRRGDGVWLEDYDGQRYLDAISSWWVNLFGHGNARIAAAIGRQLQQLEHVLLAGFTHAPVIELSEALLAVAPRGLRRCFYADNGSSAVEIALKMSFHYWRNSGQSDRTRFITLANSYHGETLGALAVGDVGLYKKIYEPLLLRAITAPSPDDFLRPAAMPVDAWVGSRIDAMEALLQRHRGEVCAVIVEPLVQCAGGMRMYDASYLRQLRRLCDAYQVHLIADEIAVGFGRTGSLWACEQAAVAPDIMCLSKGLTGGFLPLAVTLSSEDIYQAFYADYSANKAFLHSHSYTGNPLACAAARETLAIFADSDVLAANRPLTQAMADALAPLRAHPHVAQVRQCGMIAAVELVMNKATAEPYPAQRRIGLQIHRLALQQGVLLRPLGNVLYLMPPYVISVEQIHMVARVMERCITAVCG